MGDSVKQPFEIDYVTSEEQCIELHKFLCVIAQPVLFAPIDPADSINEVLRVSEEGLSIVARCNGEIVGALGLTKACWWYNNQVEFLTDRWFFVYPQFANCGVGAGLLGEASAMAVGVGMDIVINGKLKRRAQAVGRGLLFSQPTVISPPVAGEKKGAPLH